MPENNGLYKNIYIHQNFNKNEIRSVLLENANYQSRPEPTIGSDKGLLYFDTEIGRIVVWDGENWKIVKYFDDRDIESNDNIKLQDIWADSYLVADLTEDEAKGLTGNQTVVQYWEDRPTTYIPGTLAYRVTEMESVIFPKTWVGEAGASYSSFYEPVVKNYLGSIIDPTCYRIIEYTTKSSTDTKYKVEFFDSKKMNLLQVNSSNPPTVTFYKYVGQRLSLTSISGLYKFEFLGDDFTIDPNDSNKVRRNLTGTGVKSLSDITSLSVNGQEISANSHYTVYLESSIYYLSIDLSNSGTGWINEGGLSPDDFIYLNVSNTI